MQSEIEDALADALLAGEVRDGDEVSVTLVKGKLRFRPKGRRSAG